MPYTATNNLNDIVETAPLGTEPVSNLGLAMLETRRTFKAVILSEHNPDGTHKTVNGAVLAVGSVPLTALVGGTALGANSVSTADLQANAVTAAKIAANTITAAQVANKSLGVATLLSTGDAHILVANSTGGFNEVALSGAISITDAGVTTIVAGPSGQGIAEFAEIEATGTDGGTFTSGAWQLRVLNSTLIDTLGIYNLSANKISWTVAGTYYVRASAVAYKVDLHQIQLYDPVNAVVLADGQPAISSAAGTEMVPSTLEKVITVAPGGSQTMEIRHQCATTEASDGLGKNGGFGGNTIFTRVTVIKLA